MKKKIFLSMLGFACLLLGFVHGCKKDSLENPATHIGIKASFSEEFDSVFLLEAKGWVVKDNSPLRSSGPNAAWGQGINGPDKGGSWRGFSAYSYTTSEDEFVYSVVSGNTTPPITISSWLITPVLSVKDGDKISFYTRGDTSGIYTDRMQVLMNKSASANVGQKPNSVVGFITVMFDINSTQVASGYPTSWTKYEYMFSGISGNIDTRIGFRHYVTDAGNSKGIGIDLFSFQVN